MAVYIPIRPKWNPRGVVVNYVSKNQLCVRSWPKGYLDANTATQRRQRGKMAQVCQVLPRIKNLLAAGYAPLVKRNGRRVGGYHMAVSTALREWFTPSPGGDRLDCARLQLTDGIQPLPIGLRAARHKGILRIAWHAPLRWHGAKLLLAVRNPIANQWIGLPTTLEDGATSTATHLPKAWQGAIVEVWIAFVGCGKWAKTKTFHATIGTSRTSPFSPTSTKSAMTATPRCSSTGAAASPPRREGNPTQPEESG